MVTEKTRVFVVAGGPLGNMDFLRSEIAIFSPGLLICADGGARHLEALGLTPQVIIGDMDSLAPEILERFAAKGSRIMSYGRDKRETDTQLALEYACQSLPQEVRVYGALGGRLDHTLANISLLAAAWKRGVRALLVDEWCEVFIVTGRAAIEGKAGQTVSLFPFDGAARGIDLDGFAYPLAGGQMEAGEPYGISNRLQMHRATISLASGCLLVVKYHERDSFPQS